MLAVRFRRSTATSPPSSPTGTSSHSPPAQTVGPDDRRPSRPVLRAAGGATPPADSPGDRVVGVGGRPVGGELVVGLPGLAAQVGTAARSIRDRGYVRAWRGRSRIIGNPPWLSHGCAATPGRTALTTRQYLPGCAGRWRSRPSRPRPWPRCGLTTRRLSSIPAIRR
jgi:hypothetical protein